jgi:hypothetical protein
LASGVVDAAAGGDMEGAIDEASAITGALDDFWGVADVQGKMAFANNLWQDALKMPNCAALKSNPLNPWEVSNN